MPSHRMMVTIQQVGPFAYWQQNQLFSYGSVVPCQWHTAALPAAATAASNFTPLEDSPLNSRTISSYVSPLPVQHVATHHLYHPSPALSSRAATVDPEQPIGYGSFGVVW